jgi:hypothetical protein
LAHGQRLVHIPDVAADEAYRCGDLVARAGVERGGARTVLAMLKDLTGRTVIERQPVQINDAANDPEYTWTDARQRGNLRGRFE